MMMKNTEKTALVCDNTNGIQQWITVEFTLDRDYWLNLFGGEIESENLIMAKDFDDFLFDIDNLTDDEILVFYATDEEMVKIGKKYGVH